jgi:molybdopterin converting factor small subunit
MPHCDLIKSAYYLISKRTNNGTTTRENKMKIYVKCFATFSREGTCEYRSATPFDLPSGETIRALLRRLGVAREAVKIAFVNNRIVALETMLSDGDHVALAPAVGGM